LPDGSGFLVMSNAGREFTGLAVLNATTGALSWVDSPEWEIEEVALSADGRVLVWLLNIDGAAQLRARDLRTGKELPLPTLPMGWASDVAVSGDGRQAVMLFSTPTQPLNVAAVDLTLGTEGKLRWLTDATPKAADPTAFIEPTLVRYPSGDGTEIPAFRYLPSTGSEPAAVLISIHGGPVHQERPTYLHEGFYQYLLHQGIAILAPNVRGSWGYGKSYIERHYRDWGGVDLEDFAAAARYLRQQHWADSARIGLFGASYGGFAVLSCLSRLPEFNWAAGVDMYGISNLVTLAKASPPSWRTLVNAMIGDPDADAEFLLSRSPVTHADQISAPLFVLQGANDPRVPRHESDQIVDRVRSRGVEVRYDVYPDEGHGFTKADNQTKAYSDAADFLITRMTR
jgi:dipeptidyl aminopeptidase/acylaminoacyl peptidase